MRIILGIGLMLVIVLKNWRVYIDMSTNEVRLQSLLNRIKARNEWERKKQVDVQKSDKIVEKVQEKKDNG